MVNKRGPRKEPYGTPQFSLKLSDWQPRTDIRWQRPEKIRSKPLILCLQVSARWVPPARYRDQLYREPRQDLVARRELHASYSYLGGCRFFTFRRAVSVLWFFLKADCAIDYTPISAMWSCIWRKTARQESHIADRSEVLKDNIKTTLLK